MIYEKPAHGWTCFHCGETFTTPGAARDHFGFDPSSDPACIIKIGAERGLVMAIRKAEADCEEMRRLLHDETFEAYRHYAAQAHRHRDQILAAEEAGYEKGLAVIDTDLLSDLADDLEHGASPSRQYEIAQDLREVIKDIRGTNQ